MKKWLSQRGTSCVGALCWYEAGIKGSMTGWGERYAGKYVDFFFFFFDVNELWDKHEPEKVMQNNSWKVLWNFKIQTYHVIESIRPDMVLINKIKNDCKIIDFAFSINSRIEEKGRKIRRTVIPIWKENWRKYGICSWK